MATDPRISETSRRWPDFRGGRPIELPDGQEWFIYSPEATIRGNGPGWTFDAPRDVDAILSARFSRALKSWEDATDDAGRAAAILTACWFLLCRNYRLDRDEFAAIMAQAAAWDEDRQRQLGEMLLVHVGLACARAAGLEEVA